MGRESIMNESHIADTAEFPAVDDQFAKHFGPSPPPVRVTFGALSHPGRVRANNEDHYLVTERRRTRTVLLTNLPAGTLRPADDSGYVMAVADGMGGAAFGELASTLVLRSGWDQAQSTIKWTWIITDREIEELKERLEIIFGRMNQALQERARADPACAGMGTTLTGAYTVGPEAFIGHVGDSRAYLCRAGRLTQLTRDHTLAQQCLDLGLPVPSRSWHHRLTNCLGDTDREVRVEFHHVRLADGDRLLLCTDGLTDMLPDEEIAGILERPAHPQETAHALVERALDRGGRDNVTVVLAQYELKGPDQQP
jgi:serine/threonine protein phosphatase PrpC